MDDVLIVGVELPVLAQFDELLEVACQRNVALRRLLGLFHRPGEIEELAQEASDILRVGEYQLDSQVQDLLELIGPRADKRLAGRRREYAAADIDRQNAVALRVSVGHCRGYRDQIDFQRIDVLIRNVQLAGQPFNERVQRNHLAWRRQRMPFLVGDQLERSLEALGARASELFRLRRRHQTVGNHQLQDVL